MKYFLDFEFIEGFHKPLFGKRRHFIDMISVGIVREDGATYYAISSEYNYKDASQWVKDNVIHPMYIKTVHGDERNRLNASNFHKHYGKTNKQIADDIISFCIYRKESTTYDATGFSNRWEYVDPEFYGYYADYDWVLFCSLFGTMMDLPKGYPMYCRDLKQMFDEAQSKWVSLSDEQRCKYSVENKLYSIEIGLKNLSNYPTTKNDEHHALSDAKWNMELYKFLKTF